MEKQWDNVLEPTEQDKLIYNMLQKDRIIKDIGSYIVFEGDAKIIARHQQYYGSKALWKRSYMLMILSQKGRLILASINSSGKSITMVMLAKATLNQTNFRIPE